MVDPTPPKRPSAAPDPESEPDAAPETPGETTADAADPAELADRFLDLWQDQLAAVATDPDLAETVARLWSQWLVGPAAAWRTPTTDMPAKPAARAPRQRAADGRPPESRPDAKPETPGAPPAAAASGDHGPDVGDLLARIGTLEKRLAALERPPRVRGRAAERRTRRR
ncbi:MAG: hypothetical protein JO021_10795 [Alphaproteobacteria bacterium]|nr:hypothetical protein [Alphaproteobacteria bacterium]